MSSLNELIGKERLQIHIFSQRGFMDLAKQQPVTFESIAAENVVFHLDGSLFEALHNIVAADIFVMSNSSFSYLCNFLRSGLSICSDTFWHATPEQTLRINTSGVLSVEQLGRLQKHVHEKAKH